MPLKTALLAMLIGLFASACDTTGKKSNMDREFTASPKAYTNVFELMKTYQKQTDAPGQSDGVRVIKYYEKNQRYVGYTNKASSWFTLITEDELKQRLVKIIKRRSSGVSGNLDGIVGPVRVVDGVGFYHRDGSCYVISLMKRLVGSGYDNDIGAPDFIGSFRICGGLTVTPTEFIEKIGLANESAEARYLAIISKN